MNVNFPIPDELVKQIAEEVVGIVLEQLGEIQPAAAPSPYFTVAEAAEFIRGKPQRVYDLLSSGRLTRHKDGSRTLILRAELDTYLRDGNGGRR